MSFPPMWRCNPGWRRSGTGKSRRFSDTPLLLAGERARGHEFHYSTLTQRQPENWPYAYEAVALRGAKLEGYASHSLLAGYTHLYFASNPRIAERFVAACKQYKDKQTTRWGER